MVVASVAIGRSGISGTGGVNLRLEHEEEDESCMAALKSSSNGSNSSWFWVDGFDWFWPVSSICDLPEDGSLPALLNKDKGR